MDYKFNYDIISRYMTTKIGSAMRRVECEKISTLTEIRLRVGRGIVYVFPNKQKFLDINGKLKQVRDNECIVINYEDIKYIIGILTHYSIHSCKDEFKKGCFVLENGIRVGMSGEYDGSDENKLKSITGLNFRISREIINCADYLFERLGKCSYLICGGVNSGKTTILRDICRSYGSRYKISLIDERNEISSFSNGNFQCDIGEMTDVLIGCDRCKGIISSVRTLSPEIIVTDEISECSDSDAIKTGAGCGVNFIASVHAENYIDLMKRSCLADLIKLKIFTYAVFLSGNNSPGRIDEIRRIDNV